MGRRMFVMMLLLCSALVSGAQGRKVELTVEKAVEIALNDNPTIKVANLEIERQEYVKKESLGNLLPSLSLGGQYTYNAVKQKFGGTIEMQGDHSIAGSASLSVPLMIPALYATLKMNDQEMLSAVEKARGSKISLASEVKQSFYNILLAEQSLNVLLSSQQTIEATVNSIKVSFESGLASEYDLLTAEVQLSNLQPTIVQTKNGISIAKKMLVMLLNLPADVELSLVGDLEELISGVHSTGKTLSTDLTGNSDLKQLELQQKILEAQFKTLRTQRMPSLVGFGNLSMSGEESKFSMAGMSAPEGLIWQYPLGFGAKLTIPIFSGFTNVNRERQLKNTIDQLKLQRTYAETGKEVEVKSSISNLFTAREQRSANEKTAVQAQKAYDIANVRFKAGTGTILELNNAQLQLTQAKLNLTQASYDYLAAYAQYQAILGEI